MIVSHLPLAGNDSTVYVDSQHQSSKGCIDIQQTIWIRTNTWRTEEHKYPQRVRECFSVSFPKSLLSAHPLTGRGSDLSSVLLRVSLRLVCLVPLSVPLKAEVPLSILRLPSYCTCDSPEWGERCTTSEDHCCLSQTIPDWNCSSSFCLLKCRCGCLFFNPSDGMNTFTSYVMLVTFMLS